MLLSRGVQPSDIEDMNTDRLEFWLEVCGDITAEEERRAAAARTGN